MRRLNVRLVVILFASALVLWLVIDGISLLPGRWPGAWGGLHGYMVWSNAGFFKDQAKKALAQAELAKRAGQARKGLAAYEEAVQNYTWYCRHRPDDIEALEKLGLLQANLAQITRATGSRGSTLAERQETMAEASRWLGAAVRTLESVLREERGSGRTVARRKLVEIYSNAGQYSDAEDHLSVLLEKSPNDGELLELLGTCQTALRETNEAAQSFERAIESAPDRIGAYRRLAGLLVDRNRLNRPAEADEWMGNMLKANLDSSRAHFVYGGYLASLTRVSSVDAAIKRPILLDAIVPAVLAQSVEHAIESLELEDDAAESQLLAGNKPVLAQVVKEALKLYDGDLELEKPDALLSEARRGVKAEAADPESLKKARDQALKALNLEEGSGDHDAVLAAAVKHGVLVRAMTRALQTLRSPTALLSAARKGLLEEAVQHALTARQLVGPGRDALISLFLRALSPDDHQAIRLADKHGVLLEAANRALTIVDQNRKTEISPRALGRTARRAVLLAAVKEVVESLELSDENRQALRTRRGMLADLIRHALRDCEPSSADRDALLQAGEKGVLARVAQEALAGKHGVLTEAVKNTLQANDAPSVSQVSLSHEALTDAIKNAKLPQQERKVLLLAAERGMLVDALRRVLRDPELASSDPDEILQARGSGALPRVLRRALQTSEEALEDDDLRALLLAAECESRLERTRPKGEYDRARGYADRAIELYPKNFNAYLRAADIAHQAGQQAGQQEEALAEALGILQRGWQATQSPELLLARADFLLQTGDLQEVRVCIRNLQRFGYANPGLQAQLGFFQARAEYEQGQWLAALKGRKRELLFTIPKFQGVWDPAIVDTRLRPVFKRHEVPLSPDPVKETESEDKLIIIDQAAVYEVVKQGSTLSIYRGGTQGFEEIRSGLASRPALLKQADFWAGRCYGQLENLDLELKAYQRALDVDPFYRPAKAGRAAALARSGRVEEASNEYRQIIRLGAAPEFGRLPLAGLLLAKNRRLPPPDRDWEELEQVLDDAQGTDPGSLRLVLLRAELLVTQAAEQRLLSRQPGSPAEQQKASAQAQLLLHQAEQLLLLARKADPKQVEFWAGLARLAQGEAAQQQAEKREAAWARVSGLLDEAEQELGDSVTLRLARASYLANRYGEEAKDQLRQLAEDTEQFSEAQRVQLWNGLLSSSGQVGDNEQFQEFCRRVAEKEPSNLRPRRLLLELAFRSRNDAGIKETLQDVERIEGQGPLWHYGQAVRLSLLAEPGDDPRSDEALRHLAQARKSRPSWSRVPLVTATVYDQQGNLEAALDNYDEAIEMGERSPVAIRRAVQLLFGEQRYSDAQRLLSLFQEIPSELLPTAAGI
ncbi:MAG: tetratricopeptide repeat protein, partial [Planctomycetota bacterium]